MPIPLRWFLSIIVVLAGLYLIVMSFEGGIIGGTTSSWIDILVGIILIVVGLVLRPR